MRLSTILRLTLAGSLLLGLVMWVSAMTVPALGFRASLVVGGPFVVAGLSLPALVCALTLERGRLRGLMISGMAAAAIAAASWIMLMWFVADRFGRSGDEWAKVNGIFSAWAVYCMVVGGLFMYRTELAGAILARGITLGAASLLVFLTMMMILFADSMGHRSGEEMAKLLGILGIITIFGLLLTMILARLKQLTTGEMGDEEIVRMDLRIWCPRCQTEQAMQTGGGTCQACGLAIKVTVP
jgi:hypothetical protein